MMMDKCQCFKASILDMATKSSKPLFLIGFMGSGKSTLGAIIAQKSCKRFIDLDIYISQKHNKSIPEIFENEDEHSFRVLEHNALLEIIRLKNIIVATGGGTPCFFDNMTLMNNYGITVYIKTLPEKLYERLAPNKNLRPLIAEKNDDELFEYIVKELSVREKYYALSLFKV